MKVVFIVRATLFTVTGGDTLQVVETARHLNELGISVDIKLTHEKINYSEYDLLHFFNLIRPADILKHIRDSKKPYVITPILVNYSEYDKYHRKGFAGKLFHSLSPSANEYFKTIARWLKGKDHLVSASYIWKGQKRSMQSVLENASLVFPHADKEWNALQKILPIKAPHIKVPNGVEANLFNDVNPIEKDPSLVICVARIEGIKNQLTLIRALNNTNYRLLLIGAAAPNQHDYYRECKKIAAENVSFIGYLPQAELLEYYRKAKVHVLPSWFEACGLSSLEAAVMGCNVVITNRGFASSYFGEHAFYCNPAMPASIREAIERASISHVDPQLKKNILANYTWKQAALKTASGYRTLLPF